MNSRGAAKKLQAADMVAIARASLNGWAQNEALAPSLERGLDTYKDDRGAVGVVLAAGAVATALLITATTAAEGELFGVRFKKNTASVAMVKAIIEPIANALAKLTGAS